MIKAQIKPQTRQYERLSDLMRNESYVGFEPYGCDRYMLVTAGPAKGSAVNAAGTWASIDMQPEYTDGYYIFATAAELYEWMKG